MKEAPAASGFPAAASPAERVAAFGFVSVVFSLPVLLVRWPPILDVAQQIDQIRLFAQALDPLQDTYEIQWLAPNKLSYPLLALADRLGGATWGPRLGIVFCLIAMLAAIHLLGATFRRPLAGSVLASVFVLATPFYGGFLNFVVGGLGLWWWLRELGSERALTGPGWKLFTRALLGGFLLYFCHALWLAAGFGLTLVSPWMRAPESGVRHPGRSRALGWRLAGLAPWVAWTVAWLIATANPDKPLTYVYVIAPWRRLLDPTGWTRQLLGGVVGPAEPAVVLALALWVAVALLGARRERLLGSHRLLLVAAGTFLVAGLLLPDVAVETQLLARRWMPWAGICLLLAIPAPKLSRPLKAAFSLVVVARSRGGDVQHLAPLRAGGAARLPGSAGRRARPLAAALARLLPVQPAFLGSALLPARRLRPARPRRPAGLLLRRAAQLAGRLPRAGCASGRGRAHSRFSRITSRSATSASSTMS